MAGRKTEKITKQNETKLWRTKI